MNIQKYFSLWWNSRTEDPFFFYGVIANLVILLGLIFWLAKIFIQKTESKRHFKKHLRIKEEKETFSTILNLEPTSQTKRIEKVQEKGQSTLINTKTDIPIINKKDLENVQVVNEKYIRNPEKIETKRNDEKLSNAKAEPSNASRAIPVPKIEIVKPEKETQAKEKYIGYNPINIFLQTDPLNFPYVIMPKANNIIKFPRKGRVGRKGFKEESFKVFVDRFFKDEFQVFDDRFIMVKNSVKPFEPDFTLVNEKDGINIFLNIEIDEPYEGLNDITKRKATHFQYADTNRNNSFLSRGWIVIRFAEIQIHQDPIACCNFIADVIKSINSKFIVPATLVTTKQIRPVKQWTKEEAEAWSQQKYREQYLGITNFGLTAENQFIEVLEETELGKKIEEKVIEVPKFIPPSLPKEKTTNPKLDLIRKTISSNQYLSFIYQGNKTITKPIRTTETHLVAYCYIKNSEQTYNIYEVSDILQKNNYYILRIAGPIIGLDKISNAVNMAISYKRFIRMKYTRVSWDKYFVDHETGELILGRIEAEESVRTISNVQLSINALGVEHIRAYHLNSNYITAYCNRREAERTFRFDRIGQIEILDL